MMAMAIILSMLAVKMAILTDAKWIHQEWVYQFRILYSALAAFSFVLVFIDNAIAKYVFFVFVLGIASLIAVPFRAIEAIRILLLLLVLFSGFACRSKIAIIGAAAWYIAAAVIFMNKILAWPLQIENIAVEDIFFLGAIGLLLAILFVFLLDSVNHGRALDKKFQHLQNTIEELSAANIGYGTFTQMARQQAALEERNRIARDIHDGVGYTLTNIIMLSETTLDACPEHETGFRENIEAIRMQAKTGLYDTRRALKELRSTDQGLPRGIEAIRNLTSTYSQATGIRVKVEQLVESSIVENPVLFLTIYRFIQEALTNTFRHGYAGNVCIRFQRDDKWLIVAVSDDGKGAVHLTEGIGLQGMRERIECIGGDLSYEGRDGFTVVCRLPVQEGGP